ncbi:HopJ type III effector protein [Neptunomonas concharum]|uniref:HopJ type III effector protein n=1 Tax=Neptunomonas concharum TaxID=1031538 RepID=A0A5P1RC62_9GAMM|nr:HopJ type III effector protein [Neptunomonas concharum]QEQ97249.1 HopJ type III effector protein [Neptunomonas concharum]
MTPEAFCEQLNTPAQVDFEDSIAVISEHFDYTPTAFTNGLSDSKAINGAGQNEGSCKIFAFAKLMELNEQQTLHCFGRFYQDVLNTPEGNDHANIRNFMQDGWTGITFEGQALTRK